MARFIVMTDCHNPRGDNTHFVRDGFRPFAIALPLVWLLWNRLWLEAALMFAATGLIALVVQTWAPHLIGIIPPAVSALLGVLTALEGPAWLIAALQRQGFDPSAIIHASSRRSAEEQFAASLPASDARPVLAKAFQPVSQASLIPLTGA